MGLFVRTLALIVFVGFVGALVACSSNHPDVKSQISAAITTEKNSKTLSEYEASSSHPDVIFAQWTADESGAACGELVMLDPVQLMVFEEQIENPANEPILGPCLQELDEKLNDYYAEQRKKIAHPLIVPSKPSKPKPNVMPKPVVPTTTVPQGPVAKPKKIAPQTFDQSIEPGLLPNLQKTSGNNFKFADSVELRDVSHGYSAYRGDLKRKEVVLTFDDGPHPQYSQSIVHSLSEVNAKALFFELGNNVRSYPNVTKLIAAGGNAIGTHSMTHACIAQSDVCARHNARGHIYPGEITEEQAMAEIQGSQQAVFDVLGWVYPYFRFPYGESSPNLIKILNDRGIANFLWSIDSNDWKAQPVSEMIAGVFEQLDRQERGIILFHDIQRKTAEALPEILSQLYAKGYSVVFLEPQDAKIRFHDSLVNTKKQKTEMSQKP